MQRAKALTLHVHPQQCCYTLSHATRKISDFSENSTASPDDAVRVCMSSPECSRYLTTLDRWPWGLHLTPAHRLSLTALLCWRSIFRESRRSRVSPLPYSNEVARNQYNRPGVSSLFFFKEMGVVSWSLLCSFRAYNSHVLIYMIEIGSIQCNTRIQKMQWPMSLHVTSSSAATCFRMQSERSQTSLRTLLRPPTTLRTLLRPPTTLRTLLRPLTIPSPWQKGTKHQAWCIGWERLP